MINGSMSQVEELEFTLYVLGFEIKHWDHRGGQPLGLDQWEHQIKGDELKDPEGLSRGTRGRANLNLLRVND